MESKTQRPLPAKFSNFKRGILPGLLGKDGDIKASLGGQRGKVGRGGQMKRVDTT